MLVGDARRSSSARHRGGLGSPLIENRDTLIEMALRTWGVAPGRAPEQVASTWAWSALGALALGVMACGGSASLPGDAPSSVAPPQREAPNQDSTLGYNLDFPGDWSDLPPFIDLIKNSRAPVGECDDSVPNCDGTSHLDLGADGWPRSLRFRDDPSRAYSSIQIIINSSDHRPDIGSRFIVTWDGSGSLEVANGADVKQEDAHRLSFTLQSDVTWLSLTEIDPAGRGDYLRNIRVFRADQEDYLNAGELFNPEMLAFLEPFRNLRFMDWMESNEPGSCSGGSKAGQDCYALIDDDCGGGRCVMPGRWQERPDESAPSLLSAGQYLDPSRPELGTKLGGYALEAMVALANRLPADPHFNLPADYDEDYVRGFAQYLKDHLAPGLRASIEYSNEVWNWGFPQANYAQAQADKLWPGAETGWLQYLAGRTETACSIVKDVFKGQEGRIRCLISPQTGWRDLAETVLDCPLWAADHGNVACSTAMDAINITGYFSGCLPSHPEVIQGWLAQGKSSALSQGFTQLEQGGLIDACSGDDEDNLDYTIDGYRYFSGLAKQHGLGLYVYESGTHFNYDGDDDAVNDFFVSMTRDERMHDLYTKNFSGFREQNGDILNVWGWIAPDDMWANADSIRDRQHPKYRAITDFVTGH
jgi:hypothetical protein